MPRRNKVPIVGEDVKIAVDLSLKKFNLTEDQKELEFPSSLTSEERAYIHQVALQLGLKSKSRGKGASRYLTVYKREGSTIVQADAVFQLLHSSRQNIYLLLHKYPLTNKERQELLPLTERDRLINTEARDFNKATGRLTNGVPQVPCLSMSMELHNFRKSLPVWHLKGEIMYNINNNQVIIISGETGSGKTTQVPQYIMEHCNQTARPCRIICTQPRRLSAITVSERVSAERDERIGQSVGYQVRLESRVSPKTVLTYCTNGVLLRTLMGGDSALATVTHVIVDEVHERDRFSDFLLIVLRESLSRFQNLRLILMSATMDTQLFVKYFGGCPVLSVPGNLYPVEEFFLEDILKSTGYLNGTTRSLVEKRREQRERLEKWTETISEGLKNTSISCDDDQKSNATPILGQGNKCSSTENVPEKVELEPWLIEEMDRCMSEAWLSGSEDAFTQLLHLVLSENVYVDYQHSETSVTSLMVAASRGNVNTVEQLLNLGANLNLKAPNGWSALDWARHMKQTAVIDLLEAYMNSPEIEAAESSVDNSLVELSQEDKDLLDVYHQGFNDEKVNIDLIMALLLKIHSNQENGAVLVFLPGYEEITSLRDKIYQEEKKMVDVMKFNLFILHSNMQTIDQKRVFHPSPAGVRKIILSTNIAETSITIDDVVFVIDSGKVKERSFDALSGINTLHTSWASKACCQQRRGRAGRTRRGYCYHIFSRIRYQAMQPYQTPEILRVPLQELCLNAKLLAPSNIAIADFLAKAIEPPPFLVTRHSVQMLKMMDALDSWEDLTELGHHLPDLPLEPHLGKMLLYSIVLKCLDPVLTIVTCMAHRDPFILPSLPSQKRASDSSRKKLAAGSYSDHMALLRAFQVWQQARSLGRDQVFCEKNLISSSTMEMVVALRSRLLGQLRASGFVRARGGGDIRDLNTNSEQWAVVKAALCAGLYPNLIRVDREHCQLRTQKESKVLFHQSSTLRALPKSPRTTVAASHKSAVAELPSDWLLYDEMSQMGRLRLARGCTLVSPITVALFAGSSRLPPDALSEADVYSGDGVAEMESDSEAEERGDGSSTILKIDDWVVFRIDAEAAHLALQLRQKFHSLLLRRLRAPTRPWSQVDESVLRSVVSVLVAEEQALGIQQPPGIGQRPKPAVPESQFGSARGMISDESHGYDERGMVDDGDRGRMQRMRSHGGFDCSSEKEEMAQGNTISAAVRYFVIKANSQKAIEASLGRGVWAFTPTTERKLLKPLKEGKIVLLIFSVQGSGHFQGFARLRGEGTVEGERCPELTAPNLGAPRPVEWLKRANIPFQACRHLLNPFNENRKVQSSRDGQEIEPSVGNLLCSLWDKVPPFVPKATLFDRLGASPGPHSSPPSHGMGGSYPLRPADRSIHHGRPIRGHVGSPGWVGGGGGGGISSRNADSFGRQH
ncbi:3'-5' RNA helicase YTHDC2-like isoform X2 [Ischnura elegans]|uniref:3'-5' RNA helicase YTHDC2-like isoform X2 n=1 Tax=Ischnura elegans TaxID=197161 RepID=UPI001ED869AC|nr:3'-5' RNA helicase YTHDC2-like isoform X2 [Ischnura elegans]